MDQAAQAAVLALSVHSGDTVLDVCAAPGGKSGLLAHMHTQARIIAVERDSRRLLRLRENLARLQAHHVTVVQGDATALAMPDASVDAVLLDAPCTASGIIRRHPDAKFLHGPDDVMRHAVLQRVMLVEALRVLRPGGHLLYAVCSIHGAENERVVEDMAGLQQMQRLLPDQQHDGFFFAVIRKPT
jgi:16S rRNA (cytosine967-C5)-methyltransferase